jgi:hypothetical protein
MDLTIHLTYEGARMQRSQRFQREAVGELLDVVGGEPLAGSRFEAEEPDPEFSSAKLEGQE